MKIIFLIGFLSALLIFGFNTPLLPLLRINYTVKTSWSEFLTALGTILSAVIALVFGLWGEPLKRLILGSDVVILDHHENSQEYRNGNVEGQTRLELKNIGGVMAENVMVYINEFTEGGRIRKDFFPVALSWTHRDGTYSRNLGAKEVGYLDLARVFNKVSSEQEGLVLNRPILALAINSGAGIPTYENINEGVTELKIRVSQNSGKYKDYAVMLFWKKDEPCVEIIHVTPLDSLTILSRLNQQ